MNILFFQYGDYAEAWRNLAAGGRETYRQQKDSVDFVASLAGPHQVWSLAICDRPHQETLAPGLHSIGITHDRSNTPHSLAQVMDLIAPEAVVLRTPHGPALDWARKARVPTLPVYADLFPRPRHPWAMFKSWRQRQVLMDPIFPGVANHSLGASLSLRDCLYLPAGRILPWDRAPLAVDPAAKAPPADPSRLTAFYAGALSEPKGLGDCLEAVRLLAAQGLRLDFAFAGDGDIGFWQARADKLGIADQVQFLGLIPNDRVRAEMRARDLVVVPSRHDYAEGLPNTLCEGLASRSAVVISDHPAFAGRLQADRDALVFAGGNPQSLASAVARLAATPELYLRLSHHAPQAYAGLFFGTEWKELIRLFVNDPHNATGWTRGRTLDSYLAGRA